MTAFGREKLVIDGDYWHLAERIAAVIAVVFWGGWEGVAFYVDFVLPEVYDVVVYVELKGLGEDQYGVELYPRSQGVEIFFGVVSEGDRNRTPLYLLDSWGLQK